MEVQMDDRVFGISSSFSKGALFNFKVDEICCTLELVGKRKSSPETLGFARSEDRLITGERNGAESFLCWSLWNAEVGRFVVGGGSMFFFYSTLIRTEHKLVTNAVAVPDVPEVLCRYLHLSLRSGPKAK
jgi:hypothetical protein